MLLRTGTLSWSYARGFVFVKPEGIPAKAVRDRDRAATVLTYRCMPPRSDYSGGGPSRGVVRRWLRPCTTDYSVMSFQHANGVPN